MEVNGQTQMIETYVHAATYNVSQKYKKKKEEKKRRKSDIYFNRSSVNHHERKTSENISACEVNSFLWLGMFICFVYMLLWNYYSKIKKS